MKKLYILLFFLLSISLQAQKKLSDAHIVGDVQCNGEHLPFMTITLDGTTIGTTTDATGHYQLTNVPVGIYTLRVSGVGFKAKSQKVSVTENTNTEVKFVVDKDVLNLEEVVVSANRSEQKRTEAPVIVNTISPDLFNTSQSVTLGDGLNFSPGLRLENNCQNCGFSQVRMNGMEGPYSQILINSRPVFSGLAGVYGLELIPTNMIEKVEIVRGGGSALFGSNAIAGTINIILKDPKMNTFEAGANYTFTGVGVDGSSESASDHAINFNTTLVTDDRSSGVSLYGFTRTRELFDANGDGLSEIAPMKNLTFGSRMFHKFGSRDRLVLDFFAINENREGGNMQDKPLHEREVAEAVEHDLKVAGLTYERYFREYDMFSVYVSGQFLNRDSYYGANYSVRDYGYSTDQTYNVGAQYKAAFNNATLVSGLEYTADYLKDKKLGYPEYSSVNDSVVVTHTENTIVSDQSSVTTGVFAQYDVSINKLKVSAGARLDRYEIKDFVQEGNKPKTGKVLSPRISLMYNIVKPLQARVSYSQGYRAPQIFDEDLHILSSSSQQVLHKNDPDLKQETSHSYMASLDFNELLGTVYTGLLVEGFYTKLVDAFGDSTTFNNGITTQHRVNTDGGAVVKGVNMELRLKPLKNFTLTSGFTFQKSAFEEVQEDFAVKTFFRTPEKYGFVAVDIDFLKSFCFSTSGTYTGTMLVPYYGVENPAGELRESDSFFDLGVKLSYSFELNNTSVVFSGGVKNVFNSYQNDFDVSADRDPAYMYGPTAPRSVYFGVKFGNVLAAN